MKKAKGKTLRSGREVAHPKNDGDACFAVEPPFDLIAHNVAMKEFWDSLQNKIDNLSDSQCLTLIDRQLSVWTGHRNFAKEFAKIIGENWDGGTAEVVGSAVLRAVFSRMNAYHPIYRPAPGITHMGEFDGCVVLYHAADAQYEVYFGHKRERFSALYNPLYGMDIDDMRTVTEVARKLKGQLRGQKVA